MHNRAHLPVMVVAELALAWAQKIVKLVYSDCKCLSGVSHRSQAKRNLLIRKYNYAVFIRKFTNKMPG